MTDLNQAAWAGLVLSQLWIVLLCLLTPNICRRMGGYDEEAYAVFVCLGGLIMAITTMVLSISIIL